MKMHDIIEGLCCAYENRGEPISCELCKKATFCDDSPYKDCFDYFIACLKDEMQTQINCENAAAFSDEDRIWENGIEIE